MLPHKMRQSVLSSSSLADESTKPRITMLNSTEPHRPVNAPGKVLLLTLLVLSTLLANVVEAERSYAGNSMSTASVPISRSHSRVEGLNPANLPLHRKSLVVEPPIDRVVEVFDRYNAKPVDETEQLLAKSSCGTWLPYKDAKCIKIIDEAKNFNDALKMCRQADSSSTLLSIRSPEEQSFMETIIFKQQKVVDAVWLGAESSTNNPLQYIWTEDGSDVQYSNWIRNAPSNSTDKACVHMKAEESVRGKWADVVCRKKNLVVCQKPQTWSIGRLQQSLMGTRNEMEKIKVDVESLKVCEERSKKGLAELEQEELARRKEVEDLKMSQEILQQQLQLYMDINAKNFDIVQRRQFIKEMARSAWRAYAKYAWGDDSLSPVTRVPHFGEFGENSGRSVLAAMSTLYVMGLETEFNKSRHWLETKFNFAEMDVTANLFYEISDYMGGLLSCYALTGDKMFREKAYEVGKRLTDAYRYLKGIPSNYYNPKTKVRLGKSHLSYFGGQYLEYMYMAHLENTWMFETDANHTRHNLQKATKPKGLYFESMNSNLQWNTPISSLFELSREFYRNLIYSYIQSDSKNEEALLMYRDAIEAIDANHMFETSDNGVVWARHYNATDGSYGTEMQYSGCYLGAMLALGAKAMKAKKFNDSDERSTWQFQADRHHTLAVQITETCQQASRRSESGLGPQAFDPTDNFKGSGAYLLSPELAESFFILWRLTKDSKYREYAWQMAQAINRHCRTASGGFSSLIDADNVTSGLADHQPSLFLSATLKYLYLIFTDDDVIPLDKWIFNSVGHPLPIRYKHTAYPW